MIRFYEAKIRFICFRTRENRNHSSCNKNKKPDDTHNSRNRAFYVIYYKHFIETDAQIHTENKNSRSDDIHVQAFYHSALATVNVQIFVRSTFLHVMKLNGMNEKKKQQELPLKIAAKLSDKETESGKSTYKLCACETRFMRMNIFSSLMIRMRVMLVSVRHERSIQMKNGISKDATDQNANRLYSVWC